MNKQDLIDKLEQEYENFTDRIALLPARDIIARADVIAGYHHVLEYIRGEDFDLSDITDDTGAPDLGQVDGLLEDIYELFSYTTAGELDDEIAETVRLKFMEYCSVQAPAQDDCGQENEDDYELEP